MYTPEVHLYNGFQTLEWSVSWAQSVMTSHLLQSAEEEATKKNVFCLQKQEDWN